ncbi:MAG: Flp pilus assembly complex ATPase component TadA, partial [Candidatus Omnitrophica bacterium]|nr:Flp pilus assembly complex ATPase component TadA [Candidatus Omnitrophota bacterium]
MARLMALKKKLKEVLLENKLLSEKDLDKALTIQKEKGGQLSKILVEQGMVSQKELMVCLGTQLGIPPINLSKYKVDPEVVKLIPERVARHYMLMPVSKIKNVISVAMVDPLNLFALDDIKALTRSEVQTMITTSDDIVLAIEKYYGAKMADMAEVVKQAERKSTKLEVAQALEVSDIGELTKGSKEAPVIKLVNVIVAEGLKNRASDIHLEPFRDRVRVRYRIDGVLHDFFTVPKKVQNALITRLKIMSNLDITQR